MKYARKCSFSGKGMNKGWYIFGEYYSEQSMADEVAAFNGYDDFEQMFEAEWEDNDNEECYYTEWEDEDDYQYEEVDGVLTEIE